MRALLKEADKYKNLLTNNKPILLEGLANWENDLRNDFVSSSDAMEGIFLTTTETGLLREMGNNTGEYPDRGYNEVVGHGMAYDYMLSMARTEQLDITEDMIKRLHYLLYHRADPEEAGQYRNRQADLSETGRYRNRQADLSDTEHLQPNTEDVPHLMEHFINQMRSSKKMLHPIEYAAICYKRLMDISPFKEGNGRVAGLLMNAVLVNHGYFVTIIPPERQEEFINALILSKKDNNTNIDGLIDLLAEFVIEAMKGYISALKISEI